MDLSSRRQRRLRAEEGKAGGGRQRGRGGRILVGASEGWDPVCDGRQQLEREKKGGGKEGCISHGGFEYKHFYLASCPDQQYSSPAPALMEHSTHLLNKIECQHRSVQKLQWAAPQGKNMDFMATMY